MTRAEIEAVAAQIEARADAREEEGASEQREAEGMRIAVAMFREALAKSEAAHVDAIQPNRKTCTVPADTVHAWPSPYSAPREIPEAGSGLWSVVALARIGVSDFYSVEFSQRPLDKVSP